MSDEADGIAQMDEKQNSMGRMFALGKVTRIMRKYL